MSPRLEARSLRSGCGQGCAPSGGCGEGPSCSSSFREWPRPSSLCLLLLCSIFDSASPSLLRTPAIRFGAHSKSKMVSPQDPYLKYICIDPFPKQVHTHRHLVGVRTWAHLLGDTDGRSKPIPTSARLLGSRWKRRELRPVQCRSPHTADRGATRDMGAVSD